MNWTKTLKIIVNVIYIVGVFITLGLAIISLFGSSKTINPMGMISFTWKEWAFSWLALGTVPMLLACMGIYKFSDIKNSTHKKRNFTLIFIPGFICLACSIIVIGVIIIGMINTFVFKGKLF